MSWQGHKYQASPEFSMENMHTDEAEYTRQLSLTKTPALQYGQTPGFENID